MSAFPSFLARGRTDSSDSLDGVSRKPGPGVNLIPGGGRSLLGLLSRVSSAPLLGLIWLYRQLVSPALHWAGGPSCGCRFYPTCSTYASEAIRVHGSFSGLFLAVKRLVRCTPLHPGGIDFVPSRSALRPHCVRTSSVRHSL